MLELVKLYDCVGETLGKEPRNWEEFAKKFKNTIGANIALYRIQFSADKTIGETVEILATSEAEIMKKYVEQEIFKLHPVPEASLPPLEPLRRTDVVDDEEFKTLGPLSDFLLSHDMFYLMVVPALMPDNSYVGLYVWRSHSDGDFSDLEKQRLALVMRYLLATVSMSELIPIDPDEDLKAFGKTHNLTDAEQSVLAGLINGYSPKLIAENTDRTYGTVRWHIQNILEKCQVKSQKNLLTSFYALLK